MQDLRYIHSKLTSKILKCCFDVMNELGVGFNENVYRNALFINLKEQGLLVDAERKYDVIYKDQRIGTYIPDLIVENEVIVELKCCESLNGEHKSQLINYLKVSGIMVGLLINFGHRKVEFHRVYHPDLFPANNTGSHVEIEEISYPC